MQRSELLTARGIAVAHPAQLGPGDDASTWIVTPWVEGAVGAMALQAPGSSLELADRDVAAACDVDLALDRPTVGWPALVAAGSGAALQDAIDRTCLVADQASLVAGTATRPGSGRAAIAPRDRRSNGMSSG